MSTDGRRAETLYQFLYLMYSLLSIVMLGGSLFAMQQGADPISTLSLYPFLMSVFIFACGKAFDLYSAQWFLDEPFLRGLRITSLFVAGLSLLASLGLIFFMSASTATASFLPKEFYSVFIAFAILSSLYNLLVFVFLCIRKPDQLAGTYALRKNSWR